ncbi:LssY C-terminal domain-containing protein [Thermodesulfobacteriota bacterium]
MNKFKCLSVKAFMDGHALATGFQFHMRPAQIQSSKEDAGNCRIRAGHILFSCLLIFSFLTLCGCATFKPKPIDESVFRNRGEAKSDGEVQVTATVLDREETKETFNLDLYKSGIQPIWLEIENNTDVRIWFPSFGVDPDYFAPFEVAYKHRSTLSKQANTQMEQYFHEQAMSVYVPPGTKRSGFVFTNLDLGTKAFNVDLLSGDHEFRRFTFFISVPGLRASHQDVDWDNLYSRDEIVSYDETDGFRKALEGLPCCSTNKDASKKGDPLNIVIVGSGKALHQALIRSGWDETESLKADVASKTKRSAGFSKQNRYASLVPFYLYGRPQDAAFRKTRDVTDEKNHLRLWLSPMRYEDQPVWVGQISRDIKVRFLKNIYQIEPLVDEARTYLLQDLWYTQTLLKYGYVKGVGEAPMSAPHQTFNNDTYFTDGYRTVMWVTGKPVSLSEVETMDGERPIKTMTDN